MSEEDDHPLNLVAIRVWDIDENSTHYDKMVAAPSDEDMKLMWIFWSLIMAMVTTFAGFVFVAILLDKKTRKNPFNVYLLCLMVPDILMSFLCFITCWLNAATGHFYSEGLCYFQSFYMIFGIGANSWLNAIIARQLYKMLDGARRFRRYKPPTRKTVIFDALKVYAFAAFVASWGIIDKPWWPHKTGLVLGTACLPIDYDTKSTIFFYCVFFPALIIGPMSYVLYVLYMIKKNKLMPPTGKRRLLALYFFRLAAVFVIMWLPALVCLFIIGAWVHHWVVWAGGAWAHMQGLLSTALSLMKPDIGRAASNLVAGDCVKTESERHSSGEAWYPWNSKGFTRFSQMSARRNDSSIPQLRSDLSGNFSSQNQDRASEVNRVSMTGEVTQVGEEQSSASRQSSQSRCADGSFEENVDLEDLEEDATAENVSSEAFWNQSDV